MSIVDRILDVSYHNLSRLYDNDYGGFFFHIDEWNRVNGDKLVRYNARIVELLADDSCSSMIYSTVSFLTCDLVNVFDDCFGDVGLLITALDKLGIYEDKTKVLRKRVYEEPIGNLKRIVPDRILWLLESCSIPELEHYVLDERKLRHRYFVVDYVCVSAVLYAIHYLVMKELYEEALKWYKFLVDTFMCKSGEWLLSYFPFLNWTYRKAFSVHQLGMAPLYLLELYEATHEESILDVVSKSVRFGLKFLNGDRVYRTLWNKETRCYECAFDIKGLKKFIEVI